MLVNLSHPMLYRIVTVRVLDHLLHPLPVAMDQVHVIASSKIVWQNFDDELIGIHLESGIYYSLNRSGAAVWRMLEAGLTPAEAAHRGGNGTSEARAAI